MRPDCVPPKSALSWSPTSTAHGRQPGPARQGGEGPQRDAVATVARHSTCLLAAVPATALSLSRPRRGSSDRSDRPARRLSAGGKGGRAAPHRGGMIDNLFHRARQPFPALHVEQNPARESRSEDEIQGQELGFIGLFGLGAIARRELGIFRRPCSNVANTLITRNPGSIIHFWRIAIPRFPVIIPRMTNPSKK